MSKRYQITKGTTYDGFSGQFFYIFEIIFSSPVQSSYCTHFGVRVSVIVTVPVPPLLSFA